MTRSTSHWTTAIAAAALIGLPVAGYAQSPSSTQPQTPQTQTPTQTSPSAAGTPAEHVQAAKQAVSSIQPSTLPASARPKITQLRSHLNTLEREVAQAGASASGTPSSPSASSAAAKRGAAAKGNWGTEVAAIDKILTDLIGPETGSAASTGAMTSGSTTPGATGTAGRSAATIDDATKNKLRDVRREITALATSMSGTSGTPKTEASAAPAANPSPDTMGSAQTSSAARPAPGSAAQSAGEQPAPTATATNPPAGTTPANPAPTTASEPAQQQSATQPGAAQADREAAKQHLSDAREALSQLAALPEAARLQGETRTQVSQLISNFNELITTQNDWKASYAKVEGTLNSLLGPETSEAPSPTSTTGATTPPTAGTSGTGTQLEPAIRAKLQEFRTHLKLFEQAAGGGGGTSHSATTGGMPPSVSTSSTANPAAPSPAQPSPATPNPTEPTPTPASPTPASPAPSATPGATGTSGMATPSATGTSGTMTPSADVDKHLDAIAEIINKAKNGKLDKAETDQIKMHVDQLRELLKK